MMHKHRMVIMSTGIILLLFGGILVAAGDYVAALLPSFPAFKLAFVCPGGSDGSQYAGSSSNISQCTTPIAGQTGSPPTEQYPNNAWQLRWGTVKYQNVIDASGGFTWTQFWYETYRPMLQWSDDYGTGVIQPNCGNEDFLPDLTTACNLANMGTGASSWFGYTATRTFLYTSTTQLTFAFTVDDGVRLTILDVGTGTNTTPIYSWIGKSDYQRPLTYTATFQGGHQYRVKMEWFQYTGAALIGMGVTGTSASLCDVNISNVQVYFNDQTHGKQVANDPAGTYSVDSSFTIGGDIISPACIGHITGVPVVLVPWQDSYTSNPIHATAQNANYHLTQTAPNVWSMQFNLAPGKYFLNVGVQYDNGQQWGLHIFTLSFVNNNAIINIQGALPTPNWLDWFTPIRDLGIIFSVVGLAVVFMAMPRKP